MNNVQSRLEQSAYDQQPQLHGPDDILGRGFLVPSPILTLTSCAALLGWGLLALRRVRAVARPKAITAAVISNTATTRSCASYLAARKPPAAMPAAPPSR